MVFSFDNAFATHEIVDLQFFYYRMIIPVNATARMPQGCYLA
jgi:hypothetical protein